MTLYEDDLIQIPKGHTCWYRVLVRSEPGGIAVDGG